MDFKAKEKHTDEVLPGPLLWELVPRRANPNNEPREPRLQASDVMVTALRRFTVYLKEALGTREREGRRNAYFS